MIFYSLSGLFSAVIASVFGIFVFIKKPQGAVNRTYAALSFWIALWGYAYFYFPISQNDKDTVLLSFQILQIGAIFIGPAFLHFVLSLLNMHKEKRGWVNLAYILGIIFAISDFTPFFIKRMVPKFEFNYWAEPGFMYHLYLVFWSWCIIYPWSLILRRYSQLSEFKQNQLKYVFIASIIGFLGGATNYPFWYNIAIPPIGTFLVGVHVLILAYAIIKYRLMDIKVTITRAGVFLAVYTLVLGAPFILSTSGKLLLIEILGRNWWLGPLVLMALLGTGGPFIYIFLKNSAESLILREQKKCQKVLKNAAVDLTRIRNIQKLLDFVCQTITEAVNIKNAAIYCFDAKQNAFILQSGMDLSKKQPKSIPCHNKLIELMQKNRDSLILEEIIYNSQEDNTSCLKSLEIEMLQLGAAMAVPCFLEDKLLDVIILGEKKSAKMYGQEDVENFNILAPEVALATENAQLYEKIEEEVREKTSELGETQKQLVQAEKLATIGTLAGGVAHEINNPLTAILTNVQMLLDSDEPDKECLEMIEDATKRCKTIVQKLMAYAKKPHANNEELVMLDLRQTTEKTVSFLKFQMDQESITLNIKKTKNECLIMGNPNELEQVITNILINAKDAIKQIHKSGIINVSVYEHQSWSKIEIQDDGVGIAKELLPRIFDPFFTTKDVGKGLGLGLSICQSIIEKHSGRICVDSEINKGARFTIWLPLTTKVDRSRKTV
ncbi:MAG: ATP-binding protein [Candidatus Omnitrophota bacterium]